MKRFTVVLMLILLSPMCVAQFQYVEVESNLKGLSNVKYFWAEEDRSLFFQAFTDGWWQLYMSKSIQPTEGVHIGLGAGIEREGYRVAGSLIAERGDFNLTMFREDGASGDWYKDVLMYQPSDLGVGVISQKWMGSGLTSSIRLNDTISLDFSAFDGGAKQLSIRRSF